MNVACVGGGWKVIALCLNVFEFVPSNLQAYYGPPLLCASNIISLKVICE